MRQMLDFSQVIVNIKHLQFSDCHILWVLFLLLLFLFSVFFVSTKNLLFNLHHPHALSKDIQFNLIQFHPMGLLHSQNAKDKIHLLFSLFCDPMYRLYKILYSFTINSMSINQLTFWNPLGSTFFLPLQISWFSWLYPEELIKCSITYLY